MSTFAFGLTLLVAGMGGTLASLALGFSKAEPVSVAMIGAAGISAYPMAARLVPAEGQRWNKQNFLLLPAMAANTGGEVGSVMAAAIMPPVLKGLGII